MNQPLNTPAEVMVEQARKNLARDLPVFIEQPAHDGKVCIVGGAPSLADTLPALRFHMEHGAVLLALNNTHDWLIERGIVPDMHVMLDARDKNAEFVRNPRKGLLYLMAAQCHPDVFEALKGMDTMIWVADVPGMRELAETVEKPLGLVGGGSTVGLKAMALAYLWGFRQMHLFGLDSCYREGKHHAYPQSLNDNETRLDTVFHGRKFVCSPWMVAQAEDFDHDARQLIAQGVSLKAHGQGLLQTILSAINQEQRHVA